MTESLVRIIGDVANWAEQHRGTVALRNALAKRGCYIYGAGGYGREVAKAMVVRGYEVRGFFDTFRGGGEMVEGFPCYRPEEVSAVATAAALIVAVNNFKTPVEGIVRWARNVPFADVVHVTELPDVLGSELG